MLVVCFNMVFLFSTGHSHQLFHVFAILGTYFQLAAVELDMTLRKQWLLTHSQPITFTNTVGAALLCAAFSLCIISIFSKALFCTRIWKDSDLKRSHFTAVSDSQHAKACFILKQEKLSWGIVFMDWNMFHTRPCYLY